MRLFFCILGIIFSLFLALNYGAAKLPLEAWFCQDDSCRSASYILWQIRMPRALGALLVGAALAVSGAAMQGIFRNPLVDPSIIGISSGAALAAALYIVVFYNIFPKNLNFYGLSIAAFVGGWLVTLLLYFLARKNGELNIATMLLLGIALAAFSGALTGLLIYSADDNQLRDLTFWTMGSLAGLNWQMLTIIALILLIIFPLICENSRALNALNLGESEALFLGFSIDKVKKRLILYVALLLGVCVAFCGIIAFIGLLIPHLCRLLFGSDYRKLLPYSFCGGAIVLSLSDTLSRNIIAPAELPIGIITSLIGAPFLGFLVWKKTVINN